MLLAHDELRCKKIRRMKGERRRREWARENGMWRCGWDVLASGKWVSTRHKS